MARNIIKTLEKNFSDMKAGEKMLISSPEKITEYVNSLAPGCFNSVKQMRKELALLEGADNTCPVTTGIFLKKAIQDNYNPERIERSSMPFWRVIDEGHPIIKKLEIDSSKIAELRIEEGFK